MTELDFYRLCMAGLGGITLALVGLVYHFGLGKMNRLERKITGFMQAVAVLITAMHPDRASDITKAFIRFIGDDH